MDRTPEASPAVPIAPHLASRTAWAAERGLVLATGPVANPQYPLHEYVSDLIGNRVHEGNCDDEDGGKPSPECEKCVLLAVHREMERLQEQVNRYRAAGAISTLEVTPSGAAIDRAARHLFSQSIGSLSSYGHRQEMRDYDARSDANKAYWRTMAKEILCAAAGVPMTGV